MKRFILSVAVLLILALSFVGCSQKASSTDEDAVAEEVSTTEETSTENVVEVKAGQPTVTLTMGDDQIIELVLYPEVASNTVNNFIELAESGYYNGLVFHRVIEGFMIQGGCPDGVGTGGPGYGIKGEFKSNGVENNLSHERGVISMARSQALDSAGSQFFIMHAASQHLDGEYAAFGQVIKGIEVVDKIATVKTGGMDRPEEDQVIKMITVNLNGYDAQPTEKIK